MPDLREGGCICGAVRYVIDLTNQKTSNCHCTDCRRHIGAPYASFTTVPIQQFRWLKHPEGQIELSPKAVRRFCKHCGTYIQWDGKHQSEFAEISTATIDDPVGLVPTFEFYTKSRMEGVQPVPGAKQYELSEF